MKKIIIFATLIIITRTHDSSCMETPVKKEQYIPRSTWGLFGYLNWHNSPFNHTFNACEEVKKLIDAGADVNAKEISQMSRFHDMTPLEVAITESKCKKCITLLRQHGAKDTKYIQHYESRSKSQPTAL